MFPHRCPARTFSYHLKLQPQFKPTSVRVAPPWGTFARTLYRLSYRGSSQLILVTWGGILTMWCAPSAEWMGSQTRAGRLRLRRLSSARSRCVLASLVGSALNRLPMPISALMNSCWGDSRGAPQVPGNPNPWLKQVFQLQRGSITS